MQTNGNHSPYVSDLLRSLTPVAEEAQGVDDLLLDMDTIGQHILEAEGDIALVAERLLGSRSKQVLLLRAFTADQGAFDAFSLKSRAVIMAKLLQTFCILNASVTANIHLIKPDEAVKALTRVATAMSELSKSAPQTNNTVNVFENALRAMPPAVQEAAKRLAAAPDTIVIENINDDD